MRDQGQWSVAVGQWGGVQVRLHMFFLLFAAFTLYLSRPDPAVASVENTLWLGMVSLAVLTASVLLHEWAHVMATLRLGGRVDEVVLGPLGGMTPLEWRGEPRRELAAILAGPLANLLMCFALIPFLVIAANTNPLDLLSPLEPVNLTIGSWSVLILKLAFWINWLLFLVNLLPAYPFDGGRALRAILIIAWPESGRQNAALMVSLLARAAAIVLMVVAVFLAGVNTGAAVPPWFALAVLAIVLFFSARVEPEDEPLPAAAPTQERGIFGYDFSEGFTSLERSTPPPHDDDEHEPDAPLDAIAEWRQQRQEAKQRRQREIEAEEERRVDDILSKLHQTGMTSLSDEERALLERVSARYRHRQGSS